MNAATAARRPGHPSRPGATPTRRPANRPAVRPVQDPVARPARAPFVVVVVVLLSMGLGALLLLNTLLAQGSFTLHELDARVAELADQEQALQQKAAELASPKLLARSAEELGMVSSVNPAFLRVEDGKVLGAPVPAASPPPVVVSEAEPEPRAEQDQQAESNQKSDQKSDQGDGGADR